MILSYLGANVIKVEPPEGELVRQHREDDTPPEFQFINPNKKGIVLDLKQEEGKQAFKDLVSEADVLVENFSEGTMDSLGVGYGTLREINPELVYVHGSGYGDSGPYTDYPAMDLTVQAISGVMDLTGYMDTPPTRAGVAIGDFFGGIHMATGAVCALLHRERTGKGQYVEVGMLDCLVPAVLGSIVTKLFREDGVPRRTGNRHIGLGVSPFNAYEVRDGYVALACVRKDHQKTLLRIVDRPELIDKLEDNSKKPRDLNEELEVVVQEWLEDKSRDEIAEFLREAGIPCAPVHRYEELLEDPHLETRDMIHHLPNRDGTGELPLSGMPIKFSSGGVPETTAAPNLGEHTEEVLEEYADYSSERIAQLKDKDVI